LLHAANVRFGGQKSSLLRANALPLCLLADKSASDRLYLHSNCVLYRIKASSVAQFSLLRLRSISKAIRHCNAHFIGSIQVTTLRYNSCEPEFSRFCRLLNGARSCPLSLLHNGNPRQNLNAGPAPIFALSRWPTFGRTH
jgi:hypothetical protein